MVLSNTLNNSISMILGGVASGQVKVTLNFSNVTFYFIFL